MASCRGALDRLLSSIGWPRGVGFARKMLNSDDYEDKCIGAELAKGLGPRATELLPILFGILCADVHRLGDLCSEEIAAVGEPAIPRLQKLIDSEKHLAIEQSLKTLTLLGPRGKEILLQACHHTNEYVRLSVIEILLRSSSDEVCDETVLVEVSKAARRLLESPHKKTRRAIYSLLGSLVNRGSEAVPKLRAKLGKHGIDDEEKSEIAESLRKIGFSDPLMIEDCYLKPEKLLARLQAQPRGSDARYYQVLNRAITWIRQWREVYVRDARAKPGGYMYDHEIAQEQQYISAIRGLLDIGGSQVSNDVLD